MKPTSETLFDGRATIWRGDCLDVLAKIDRTDHLICDPPFEATMHRAKTGRANSRGHKIHQEGGRSSRKIRTDGHASPRPVGFASIDGVRERFMPLARAATQGWFIAFCTPEGIAPWRDAIEASGARYKRACFWTKPDSAPQFNGQGPAFAVEPFVAAWCGKGVSRWNGGGRRNWFTHQTNPPDREGTHETEKPIALMMELVELFTNRGDVVLDPFMGGGTTGIAALALGRRFVGVEKDPKHYALAKGRLLSTFAGKVEGRGLIAKLIGSDLPGPLFDGAPDAKA